MHKTIIDHLNWRYATKVFDTEKKVSATDLDTVLESMRLSASSFGLQPWKFVVVSNKELRKKLRGVAWDQPQVTDASELIVLTVRTDVNDALVDAYIADISKTRGVAIPGLKGYEDMMKNSINSKSPEAREAWASRQVYIPLGTALVTAASLGIDAGPMEGFDNAQVDAILGLDKLGLKSLAFLALGYRSQADKTAQYKKVRFAKEDVVVTLS